MAAQCGSLAVLKWAKETGLSLEGLATALAFSTPEIQEWAKANGLDQEALTKGARDARIWQFFLIEKIFLELVVPLFLPVV